MSINVFIDGAKYTSQSKKVHLVFKIDVEMIENANGHSTKYHISRKYSEFKLL